MQTLTGVVERLGVKIQDWEEVCTADGKEGPESPTQCQSTTPDPNPLNFLTPPSPSRPSPQLRLGFWWGRACLFPIDHMGTPSLHQGLIRSFLGCEIS